MGSLSHLKSDFFADNIKFDNNKEQEYGIVPFEMDNKASDLVLKDVMQSSVPIKGKTNKATDLRIVDAWRVPHKDSVTSEILNHVILELNQTYN